MPASHLSLASDSRPTRSEVEGGLQTCKRRAALQVLARARPTHAVRVEYATAYRILLYAQRDPAARSPHAGVSASAATCGMRQACA